MKKITVLLLMLSCSMVMAAQEMSLRFDNTTGLLIKPDEQYLAKGIQDDKQGRSDSAMKNFKKSAEYGNQVAMSMIGWYHLKNKEYIESRAWLQLIDTEKLPNKSHAEEMLAKLDAYLVPAEIEQVKARSNELNETYGALPTLLKREKWKNNIKVTGSRNKGNIPLSASFSLKGGIIVDGGNARSQVDEFVYDYRYSDLDGRFTLSELKEMEK